MILNKLCVSGEVGKTTLDGQYTPKRFATACWLHNVAAYMLEMVISKRFIYWQSRGCINHKRLQPLWCDLAITFLIYIHPYSLLSVVFLYIHCCHHFIQLACTLLNTLITCIWETVWGQTRFNTGRYKVEFLVCGSPACMTTSRLMLWHCNKCSKVLSCLISQSQTP